MQGSLVYWEVLCTHALPHLRARGNRGGWGQDGAVLGCRLQSQNSNQWPGNFRQAAEPHGRHNATQRCSSSSYQTHAQEGLWVQS